MDPVKPSWIYPLFYGLLILVGCSGPVISTEIRREVMPVAGLAEVQKNPKKFENNTIIIGGEVISVINHANQVTTLLVLDRPLDDNERPEAWENSQGRFMVHTSDFLDPKVYVKGREVTVAGIVTGIEMAPVGKANYPYVVLTARQIYLWPWRYHPYTDPLYPDWSPAWYPDRYQGILGQPY